MNSVVNVVILLTNGFFGFLWWKVGGKRKAGVE
jgi:hypothetical protein